MEIRILSAGKEIGPYSESQVRQYLSEGLVAPSDLATYDGAPDWLALRLLLANLPRSETPAAPEENISSTESTRLDAIGGGRGRRGPIVLQPIFAGAEAAASGGNRKSRSGRTTLTIEPLRPTTQLPPVAKFVKREEKKAARNSVSTGPLSPGNFFEMPAVEMGSMVPTTMPGPVEEPGVAAEPQPPTIPDIPPGAVRREAEEMEPLPHAILYAGTIIGLLVLALVLVVVYIFWHLSTPARRGGDTSTAPPPPGQADVADAPPPIDPRTSADYTARGFYRENHVNLDSALADYDQAVDLDPRNTQALYRRAVARQTKGLWDGALADYNALLALDPKNAEAFSNRGYVKQARGDADGALADYGEALQRSPRDPKMTKDYYNIGLIKVQRGNLDGGIDAFTRAIELDPKLAAAYFSRGNAKNAENNLDGAIADFTRAIELDPRNAMDFFNRGYARQAQGDAQGALGDYTQAISLDQNLAPAYYNRGQIKVQQGDFDGAITDSAWAIELEPRNAQAYCNRGLAEFGKGNRDAAIADFQKFCALAPRDVGCDSVRLYLWIATMQANPQGKASEELATALENEWNSSPEEMTSKVANFLLGHIRETELLAAAVSPDPSRQPGQYCKVWYYIGMKHLVAGDTVTALADLQKSVATNQKDFCEYLFARAQLAALGQNRQASTQPSAPATP